MMTTNRDSSSSIANVVLCDNAARCDDIAPEGMGCDLWAGHEGVHFYVIDHDADGDVSVIATWASNRSSTLGDS